MESQRTCLYCNNPLEGRSDKRYCDHYCKSAHHYQQSKENPQKFYTQVDHQLRRNRKLLKEYNKAGLAVVREAVLLERGFNPRFYTHLWKNPKGDIYFFVYEFGFYKKVEHNKKKYVLVVWQEYMAKG